MLIYISNMYYYNDMMFLILYLQGREYEVDRTMRGLGHVCLEEVGTMCVRIL